MLVSSQSSGEPPHTDTTGTGVSGSTCISVITGSGVIGIDTAGSRITGVIGTNIGVVTNNWRTTSTDRSRYKFHRLYINLRHHRLDHHSHCHHNRCHRQDHCQCHHHRLFHCRLNRCHYPHHTGPGHRDLLHVIQLPPLQVSAPLQ